MLEIALNVIAASGLTAITVGVLLKVFLEKSIELSVKSRLDKAIEDHKLSLNRTLEDHKLSLNRVLEKEKLQNSLVLERSKSAAKACSELATLLDQIRPEIEKFLEDKNANYVTQIIQSFHRPYREKFGVIRVQFEVSNDLFSSYSLAFSRILEPQTLIKIIQSRPNVGKSDVRKSYIKLWEVLVSQITCLVRVSTDFRFWQPGKNYGERADKWAEYDLKTLVSFMISTAKDKGKSGNWTTYYLSLEEEHGLERFWESLPPPESDIEAINDAENSD